MTKNKKCKCGSDYDVDVKMSVPEGWNLEKVILFLMKIWTIL